jgi:hypothetical protein
VGQTSERWSMVGSGYKRLAQISGAKPTKACEQALKKMENAYKQAWKLAKENPYPLINALVAKVIRLLRTNDSEEIKNALPELTELTTQAIRLAEIEKLNAQDDFWASIGSTDANLIDYLVSYMQSGSKNFNEERFDELTSAYTMTWRRYGSAREFNSVIEHYAFLSATLKGIEPHKKLSSSLLKILSSLHSISEK